MPIMKAAKKAIRQSEKRRKRNLIWINKIKEKEIEIEKLMDEEKKEEIKKIIPDYYKIVDKASKNNVISKNTAARKKSKFAKTFSAKQKKQ